MTDPFAPLSATSLSLPKLPPWVTAAPAKSASEVAFRSGAALTVLDTLINDPAQGVPLALLGHRAALSAATATSKLEGRLAREADIRDAFHLTPPGDARGPDGDLLAFWRGVCRLRLDRPDWQSKLDALVGGDGMPTHAPLLDLANARADTHGPLAGCAWALHAVLTQDSRAERLACLASDIVLARALRWKTLLPLTARRLTKAALRDLVTGAEGAGILAQGHVLSAVHDAVGLARDLSRRASALRAITPKLRAKGSGAAVELFLSEDAVAPSSMLSPRIRGTNIAMTDRSARRLCDRLVELGVARELTGRSTFRLYGIAS